MENARTKLRKTKALNSFPQFRSTVGLYISKDIDQQNSYRFYIFSCAIYVRSIDMIDQMALHVNNDNIESPKKMNLELKQSCCLNSLETEALGTLMIRELH